MPPAPCSDSNDDGGPAAAESRSCQAGGSQQKAACRHCGLEIANPKNLKVHERAHLRPTGFPCAKCGAKYGWAYRRNHHERTVHKHFRQPAQWSRWQQLGHETTAINEHKKQWRCPHCLLDYPPASRTAHLRTHSATTGHQCLLCTSRFQGTDKRDRHERTKHKFDRYSEVVEGDQGTSGTIAEPPGKKLPCRHCGVAYSKGNLKRHELTHSKRSGHKCGLCGSFYTQLAHRDRHERNVHGHDRYAEEDSGEQNPTAPTGGGEQAADCPREVSLDESEVDFSDEWIEYSTDGLTDEEEPTDEVTDEASGQPTDGEAEESTSEPQRLPTPAFVQPIDRPEEVPERDQTPPQEVQPPTIRLPIANPMRASSLDVLVHLQKKPQVLYFDLEHCRSQFGTFLSNTWRQEDDLKILVLRTPSPDFAEMHALGTPFFSAEMRRWELPETDDRQAFAHLFAKPEAVEFAERLRREMGGELTFEELATDVLPALEVQSALLVASAADRDRLAADRESLAARGIHVF